MLCPALALLFSFAAGWRGSLAEPPGDPLGRLQAWVGRARLSPSWVNAEREQELGAILGDLRLLGAGPEGGTAEIALALVELASLETRGDEAQEDPLRLCACLGRAELESELAGARGGLLALRLALEVLEPEERRPRAERLVAAELLAGRFQPETLPALTRAAREEDRGIARAALGALAGWPDARVHLFFLEELERGGPFSRVASEHFVRSRSGLEPVLRARLARELARRYLSEDWRQAARARDLADAFGTEEIAPLLIEALSAWDRRTRAGHGSKRVRAEILDQLQRRSGRAIGPEPARWVAWWSAVQDGRIELPEDVATGGGQNSSATFFGLHAMSDRVLFVVDRSASMETAFGTSGRTRHAEAIEQLVRFLRQSGEDTRFSVALFGDQGVAWRTKLQPASQGNLELVQRWVAGRRPDGRTLLFEGLRAGLGLDAKGRLPAERCEADTVIVLCDGETAEGPDWVARWIEEIEGAQLVFHCVQIGSRGNGTLETLAQESGGEFVRVDG